MKCPKCKKGKMSITVEMYGVPNSVEISEIDCVYCNGTGEISEEKNIQLIKEEEMWCKCDESTGPKFYDNGEHPDLYKHHYRCTTCGGIVQIG